MQVQNFGEPFFLIIHEGETLAEVKVRIQKKLQVPDEEFSKWKFAVLSLGRPEYLQDSDIVFSRFQRREVYGAWEQYLGLEHSDTAPKRVYTPSQEKKKMATVERGRASWSNENKKIFIDLCIEEVQIGGRLGSHLKASSWKKIITSFNEKTKLNYDQKQLKNMWDIMKKQYAAWKKLLNQTGIGYNEDTHIVTMERERWEKYLKANPDAKVFHTKPLQFPKEMAIIFDGTMATGETKPDDMLRMPLENHNLSFASNHMSPQSSNFQEEDQEIELEDQLAEVRRKRPCPSRRKKHSGNDALVVSIDNLVSSIDSTFKTDGPTIAECIASLKKFPNVPDSLYIYALNAFRIKENREVWMSEDDDRIRMMWLKANADGSFVA